jgi:hypothetical protein
MLRMFLALMFLALSIPRADAATEKEMNEFMAIARAHGGQADGSFFFSVRLFDDVGIFRNISVDVKYSEKSKLLLLAPSFTIGEATSIRRVYIQIGYVDQGLTGRVKHARTLRAPYTKRDSIRNTPTKQDQSTFDNFLKFVVIALTRNA